MKHRYFIIHKPVGVLSQFKNNSRRKKPLLSTLGDFPDGTMAVGRLDAKSEGLLLLTTDGKWSEAMRSKQIEKEYLVEVHETPSEEELEKLRNGVELSIEGKMLKTLPAIVEAIEKPNFDFIEDRQVRELRHGHSSWLKITLREGKFRQIRKMTASIGHPTLRLIRIRQGNYQLKPIKEGEVQEIFDI